MTQPWATLVAIGENSIETRSWSTRYRGPVAIHAAKAFPPDARALCRATPYRTVLAGAGYESAEDLPRGSIIAVATLADIMEFSRASLREVRARAVRGELPRHEASFGDFSPGRFGFVLTDVLSIDDPIFARGMLGLWDVPDAVRRQIRESLARASRTRGARDSATPQRPQMNYKPERSRPHIQENA